MYWAATPASTTTRNSAAWTTFCARTTPIAAAAIATARIQNATSTATLAPNTGTTRPPRSRGSPLLHLGADLERLGFGHGVHPLAELALVVQQLGDVRLGVLELGAPEEGVERADLDAD